MSEEKWVYPPKSPKEIEALAWDIIGGRVFGSWDCPLDMIKSCFMILFFMEQEHIESMKNNNVAHVYEYLDKAGPRSVNGYPSFLSCCYINVDDIKKVQTRIKEIQEFQKTTTPIEEE